jgi:peptidoglycan hydrolase-like protein with peptidoglycan-binding domain
VPGRSRPAAPEAAGESLADRLLDAGNQGEPPAPSEPGRLAGWGRVFRGNRALWLTVAVAVLCLVVGLVVGRFVVSPADAAAAATAPAPGYITVPVEYGELSNDVILRGQVGFADSVEVELADSEVADAAVVTGRAPEVGSELKAGAVALEVAGRPVFVLPGGLPAYRTLRTGMSGPDVRQLKRALRAVGIPVASRGDRFDRATAAAVRTLYREAGYTAPVDATAAETLSAARAAVRDAEQTLTQARKSLAEAGSGPTALERKQADIAVAQARRTLAEAKRATPRDAAAVASAREQLTLAKLQRRESLRRPDLSGDRAAVRSAAEQLDAARTQVRTAETATLPYLRASEVLFLASLPRRVDAVNVSRGDVVSGPVMSVSGARIELSGSAADADATLLELGDEAFFELPDGDRHRAEITAIELSDSGGRATVRFTPDPLSPTQLEQLQGSNVRVQVPVGATEGAVLSVPFAALTAGPGGESRVEVVSGDPRDLEHARTTLVVVTTGLAAGGYVEVTPVGGGLAAGDLVVVGR